MRKPIVARAFEPGAHLTTRKRERIPLRCRAIGELVVPSYRLMACDPFECPLATPFAYRVVPGRYPVVVALAEFEREPDQRVAAVMVRLSDAEPVRWEEALVEGDGDGAALAQSAFGVDSGLGALLSDDAAALLCERMRQDEDYLERAIEDARGPLYTSGPEWFDIALDSETGLNALIFTSGWGDGVYTCSWGIDAEGNLARLVVDLDVLDERDTLTAGTADLADLASG